MTTVAIIVALATAKAGIWIALVLVAAWLLTRPSSFDRHADQALDLTRPTIGDEIEAYLRGRQR